MRLKYGQVQPAALNVLDVSKPGAGVLSDIITNATPYNGAWFAIHALAAATIGFQTDTVMTENGTPPITVAAGSFVVGNTYTIATVGTTSFTSIGATANLAGTTFVATGVGSGSGTAYAAGAPQQYSTIPLPSGDTIYGSFSEITLTSGGPLIAYRG
jgi:hypothetical protein